MAALAIGAARSCGRRLRRYYQICQEALMIPTHFAAALAAAGILVLAPARAENLSSPEEVAATAKLNQDIAKANSDADDHYAVLQKAYLQKKQENEQLWQDYRAKVKTAETQQAQYQQEKTKNDQLQQQYQARMDRINARRSSR
ncbi:MAG TPA: hypothetical protein VG798_02170 [Rhizomicrobium sp.]|nr:hypothetical protein [Rhizomicrobium sp.]